MPRISALPVNAQLTGAELVPVVTDESDPETQSTTTAEIARLALDKSGLATLVAGTVTVTNDTITDDTLIFISAQDSGTSTGALRVSARTPGVSFTILSTEAGDDCSVAWLLVEPVAS